MESPSKYAVYYVQNNTCTSFIKKKTEENTKLYIKTNNADEKVHQLYVETLNKKCLSGFDDKIYLLSDDISSYAYEHYRIQI